jgi:hypothetical protein
MQEHEFTAKIKHHFNGGKGKKFPNYKAIIAKAEDGKTSVN